MAKQPRYGETHGLPQVRLSFDKVAPAKRNDVPNISAIRMSSNADGTCVGLHKSDELLRFRNREQTIQKLRGARGRQIIAIHFLHIAAWRNHLERAVVSIPYYAPRINRRSLKLDLDWKRQQ